MVILSIVLIVVFVLVALLLSFLVLIQDEQGDSIGGLFGGGSSASPFGASSNSVLVRITAVAGTVFMALSLCVAFFVKTPAADNVEKAARMKQGQSVDGSDWFAPKSQESTQGDELVIPGE